MLDLVGSLVGAGLGFLKGERDRDTQADMAERNIELQREFAKNGIRWRVEDAKAAGIHPLYALGNQGIGFAPVSIGDTGGSVSDMARAGQDIGAAIDRMRTPDEKEETRLEALTVERAELENELLRTRIRRLQNENPVPGMPAEDPGMVPGQGDIRKRGVQVAAGMAAAPGQVEAKPSESVSASPAMPHGEAGTTPDVKWVKTQNGYTIAPGKGSGLDEIEGDNPMAWWWVSRNVSKATPPVSLLPPGAFRWRWVPSTNEFVPDYEEPESYHARQQGGGKYWYDRSRKRGAAMWGDHWMNPNR